MAEWLPSYPAYLKACSDNQYPARSGRPNTTAVPTFYLKLASIIFAVTGYPISHKLLTLQ